eukprot:CAMPEP_0203645164 /NCGR_PEP_ID=MMETSP0088-20131115/10637_1 /ASSEMBLY_ACC=CAM_ASM_001087 /TAXON_ID=426623 /ORGANISM="Chaetoceros affinis, Strain CCMP159" /LENGTH=278 /DNA_ID=CAMNT_0050501885 /DNA_START=126 /DNA_END=962 /DNA_ORIENTATION=-
MTTRIAVVTGANKGIGFQIALQLAQSGLFTDLVLACRDKDRGQEAQQRIEAELQQKGNVCSVSYEQLTIGEEGSHDNFFSTMNGRYGELHVLVNNAAMAFKGSDPTPFKEQCKPTLDINFRGTVNFTEKMMPLLRKGNDARLVNVASMAGRINQIKSQPLRNQFIDPNLTKEQLISLVDQFEQDVLGGVHSQKGWGNSNYGMSKLSLIAMTKIWAREEANHGIKVNCCCPGYCDTDMTSHKGTRSPADGARNALIPAIMDQLQCPSGELFQNYGVSKW